jgi:hypothetical protein
MSSPSQSGPGLMPARISFDVGPATKLDLTQLYKYENLLGELVKVNNINGPLYMNTFLAAFNLASDLFAKASLEYERARDEAKQARAVAHLQKAHEWLAGQGRKPTESACEQYVEMDPSYIAAREKEHKLQALVSLLQGKVRVFKDAHDDSKKIFSASIEPLGSRSGAPSGD